MRISKIEWERDPRPGYSDMRGPGTAYRAAFVLLPLVVFAVLILIGVVK